MGDLAGGRGAGHSGIGIVSGLEHHEVQDFDSSGSVPAVGPFLRNRPARRGVFHAGGW